MTKRTLLMLLATFALQPAVPAPAAQSPYVVYEVYRTRPSERVAVEMTARPKRTSGAHAIYQLMPGAEGRYRLRGIMLAQLASDYQWRTYGSPVAVPCPALCTPEDRGEWSTTVWLRPPAADRVFVAAPRGDLTVRARTPGWRVRTTDLGVHVRTNTDSDATGATVGGVGVEHFRSASAPAGRYGSVAFGQVPCDNRAGAGAATLTAGDEDSTSTITCPGLAYNSVFARASRGGQWTLSGNVVGPYLMPVRLFAVDFPERT